MFGQSGVSFAELNAVRAELRGMPQEGQSVPLHAALSTAPESMAAEVNAGFFRASIRYGVLRTWWFGCAGQLQSRFASLQNVCVHSIFLPFDASSQA